MIIGWAKRGSAMIGATFICFVFVLLVSMWGKYTGGVFPWADNADATAAVVFWKIRLPRNAAGFVVGGGLALCGAVFQALFRNTLATPYTLGVASGAAFGAALYIALGFTAAGCFGLGLSSAATMGALLSMVLTAAIARRKRGMDGTRMLLAGVAVSFTFSGLTLFAQYLSDFSGSFRMVRWMMGSLDVTGFSSVLRLGAVTTVGLLVILPSASALDLLTLGEEAASARGLDVRRTEILLFVTASILVGQIVSIAGPVGFVGMMVPHVCRKLISPVHRILLPWAFLAGGVFLVLADTAARTLIAPSEIPVGVITALLGGPFFLVLLLKE